MPLLEKLHSHSAKVAVRGMVLAPTRELAMQTLRFFSELGKYTDLRATLVVGGDSMDDQFSELARNPDVLIGTPGRLVHLMAETKTSLGGIEYVVYDEADRLFEMGFEQQIHDLQARMGEQRQTLLFSATLPKLLVDFVRAGLRDPEFIRLDADTKISENLDITFMRVRAEEKWGALIFLLTKHIPQEQQTVVFLATKHHVDLAHGIMQQLGIESSPIYGTMDPTARKIAIGLFRAGKSRVLLMTDIGARGLDVPMLDNVINFHFPAEAKLFVHRVGRAARAGRTGTAYSLVANDEVPFMVDLALFLGRKLAHEKRPEDDPQSVVYWGWIPPDMVHDDVEYVHVLLRDHDDLTPMVKVCSNGYKMYLKGRPPASGESVTRSKTLPVDVLHPLLTKDLTVADRSRVDMVNSLKNFRPPQTVFEMTDMVGRSSVVAGMMKMKRKAHSRINNSGTMVGGVKKQPMRRSRAEIEAEYAETLRAKNEAEKAKADLGKFRDNEFYLSHTGKEMQGDDAYAIKKRGTSDRLEDAIMDMLPDERNSLMQKHSVMKWDKRKKKYIRTKPETDLSSASKRQRTESGAMLSKKNRVQEGAIYEQWKQRNNRAIPVMGAEENPKNLPGARVDYRSGRKRMGAAALAARNLTKANANVRDEVKSTAQILKNRTAKAAKQDRMSARRKKNASSAKRAGKSGGGR